ncbi:MAG: hypothetical protein EXR98_23380 [Gemmataceae bacterium]|nr:hypothetical protein [Gemmataceae bacterium]
MPQRHRAPLILRWRDQDNPLPQRVIRGTRRPGAPAWHELHSSAQDRPASDQPFDFSAAIQRLVLDIATRSADFRHLEVPRILVSATQTRARSRNGLQARVTPLRFARGALTRQRRGVPYHIQRYFLGEREYLYVMTFCLPRYLDQDFEQKFVTLFHELYHISPAFDGDLRRHEGRCQFHTPRQRDYDRRMVEYAREYLAGKPDPDLHRFLRLDFGQLQQHYGAVTSIVVPRPKMVPLVGPYAAAAKVTTP